MKFINQGKLYDTDSSTPLAVSSYERDTGVTAVETLWQSARGSLFTVEEWKEGEEDLIELTPLGPEAANVFLSGRQLRVLSDQVLSLPGVQIERA